MDTPAPPFRTPLARLALALLFAAAPAMLRAQDTAKAPTITIPAGTRVTRPPLATPPIVTRPAGTTANQQTGQQLVTVPNLGGRTVDEARRLLAAAGLEVGRVTQGTGSGAPGTILQQQPRAGSVVAPKSDVWLWLVPEPPPTLSRPPARRVTVPRLAGRTVEEARGALAQANLQLGAVAEAAGDAAPGTVVRQSPRAGSTVAPGSRVGLWIVPARVVRVPRDTPAAAHQAGRVPGLVGQTMEDAREALRAAGLSPGALAEAPGATGVPGTVARQAPAAGSALPPDSRVALWLVPARRAVMPAIMGLPLDHAQVLLRQAGLRPGEVVGTGRVIGHTFRAGAAVRVGSVVNISLGVPPGPPAQVAVRPDPPPPDRPQPPPAQRPPPATRPAARPPETNPPATPAAADSAVVPDVRRLALGEAQASLAAAGFAAVVDAGVADSAGWTVSAQQPSPGAWLPPGGRVALLLDPPAVPAVAAIVPPPAATGLQPPPVAAPAPPPAEPSRIRLWIAAAVLLIVLVAAAGARRMRARGRAAPPVTGVRVALRTDGPPRTGVDGPPLGLPRLRLRLRTAAGAARIDPGSPLFRPKGGAG